MAAFGISIFCFHLHRVPGEVTCSQVIRIMSTLKCSSNCFKIPCDLVITPDPTSNRDDIQCEENDIKHIEQGLCELGSNDSSLPLERWALPSKEVRPSILEWPLK